MQIPEVKPRTPTPQTFPIFIWPTPNVTDLLFYVEKNGTLPQNKNWNYGDPYPDKKQYPNHKLVYVTPQDATQWEKHYYAADRENQDLYNFNWTSTEIGGRSFESVTRSYLIPRAEFQAGDPAPGTAMELVPAATFSAYQPGDFIVANVKQARAGQELDALYVAVDVVYVKRCETTSLGYDEATSAVLTERSNLYYKNEIVTVQHGIPRTAEWLFANPTNHYWGLSANGYITDGKKLSCDWYVIDEKQVVPTYYYSSEMDSDGDLLDSSGDGQIYTSYGMPIRSYYTNGEFQWPGIFRAADGETLSSTNDIVFKRITKYKDSSRTTTYDDISPRVQLSNPPYNGPTKILVQEYWSKDPVTLPSIDTFMQREIVYQGANYNFSLHPTIHAAITFNDNIGTNDPRCAPGAYGESFPATKGSINGVVGTLSEWPATMIVGADQKPFRGGYRIIIQTAYRPTCYVAPT